MALDLSVTVDDDVEIYWRVCAAAIGATQWLNYVAQTGGSTQLKLVSNGSDSHLQVFWCVEPPDDAMQISHPVAPIDSLHKSRTGCMQLFCITSVARFAAEPTNYLQAFNC